MTTKPTLIYWIVTNNVLVLTCYSYYSAVTLYRTVSDSGGISIPDNGAGWDFTTHPYAISFASGSLQQWVSLLHAFGQTKFREFIKSYVNQEYYAGKVYGWDESYALRGAVIFGYDLRPHMKFNGYDLDSDDYNQTSISLLKSMNLKPWYPVANPFQTGYEVNGTVFETSRPFMIPYGKPYTFNFTKCTKTRTGQGNFSIVELRPGKGHWEEIEHGTYVYTPLSNASELDEWRLVYHESTTDQTTITYGTIKLKIKGNDFERYLDVKPETGTYTVLEAYEHVVGLTPNATGTGTGIKIADFNKNYYVTVCRGTIIPPKSGNYTFYAAPDEYALFYLSESPLSGDPNADADYLILNDTVGWHEYDKNYPSQWRILETGKEYYFYFVIYNTNSVGGGKIGYIVDSQGSITDFPSDNVVFNGVTAQDLANFDWVPPVFEDLQGLDDFRKSKVDQPEIVDINAPTEQEGRPKSNLIDGNTNEIYVSRWNPATDASPYPQQYTLDFMTDVVFDYVKLSSCANMDRDVLTENLTVQCGDKILYLGEYNSTDSNSGIFHFYDNTMCKELKLSFSDNSINWSDQGSGICLKEIEVSTYFSASKVVPVTSSIFSFNSDWKDVEFGAYYNGVGKYASSGSSVEFRLNSAYTEFVIVGDKWTGTGSDVASVWINGVKVGSFSPNILDSIQYTKQYKAPLFVLRHLNYTSTYTVKVQVESGELGLSGVILMDVEENDDQESGSGLSGGAIAGITIAVLLVVAGIAVGGVFLGLYLKHRNAPDMDLQV